MYLVMNQVYSDVQHLNEWLIFHWLIVPECRPEGCLSSRSGTADCTLLCSY